MLDLGKMRTCARVACIMQKGDSGQSRVGYMRCSHNLLVPSLIEMCSATSAAAVPDLRTLDLVEIMK